MMYIHCNDGQENVPSASFVLMDDALSRYASLFILRVAVLCGSLMRSISDRHLSSHLID